MKKGRSIIWSDHPRQRRNSNTVPLEILGLIERIGWLAAEQVFDDRETIDWNADLLQKNFNAPSDARILARTFSLVI